jgi:hypothetical protein
MLSDVQNCVQVRIYHLWSTEQQHLCSCFVNALLACCVIGPDPGCCSPVPNWYGGTDNRPSAPCIAFCDAQGLTQVELYPFPIPDVFVGQPLLVSGKFEGDWPETVEICGTLPDGNSELAVILHFSICIMCRQ